jgi:hypothetical protein
MNDKFDDAIQDARTRNWSIIPDQDITRITLKSMLRERRDNHWFFVGCGCGFFWGVAFACWVYRCVFN